MDKTTARLTILFEDPFWIGVCERTCGTLYEVCKITFGAEPKDYEVYRFFLDHYRQLRFYPTSAGSESLSRHSPNPKRIQKQIRKEMNETGIGTKAQQALKLQQEQGKLLRKTVSRQQRELEKERQFTLRQEKRKEKHKGH